MIKEQNQGLAHELGGYLFKPRINQTSLDLSATMKSLQHRLPEMIAEKEKFLKHKRKDAEMVRFLSLSLFFVSFDLGPNSLSLSLSHPNRLK
jgi:hypothetical protein